MKFVFLVTFGLILSSFGVSSGAVDAAKISNKLNDDRHKRNFDNLIEDCMYLVLEHLGFADLLDVAQINEKYSRLAADVIRRKHSHLQVMTCGEFLFPSDPNEILTVAGMEIDADTIAGINQNLGHLVNKTPVVGTETIELFNGGQILNTFKHFGHVIKKFKSNHLDKVLPFHSELTGKLINKYCSKSLVDVEINYKSEMWLEHIENPFVNVENVTLRNFAKRLENKTNLSNLFPSATTLNIEWTAPISLHFPRLQTLSINHIDLFYFDKYCAFISEHSRLRHLHVSHSTTKDADFRKITANLSELEELKLAAIYHPGFSAAVISEFLKSHDNMKKLTLIRYHGGQADELQRKLKHELSITTAQIASFERKTITQL